VPYANLRAYSLLYDIRTKKAALNIKEGTFYYGLPGYVIKINKKNPDGTVEDIMIYDHQENRGNVNVTLAKSGKMYTILGGRYLVLELFDGANYSETNQRSQKPNEFTHNTFKESKIIFSLSSFDFSRTDVELFASNKLMRNISQLQADKDSLKRETVKIQENLLGNIKSYYSFLYRPHYNRISHNSKIDALIDSLWAQDNSTLASAISIAASNLNNLKNYTNSYNERLLNLRKEYHVFDVEVHRKFTQSIACIVLFLIGAPLGAIIKKGGIGLPVIISIIFFIIYYILSTTGEKWTKEEIVDIYVGMWYGIFVLLIAGLYFLNHARNDSSLFEKGYLSGLFAKLRGKLSKSPTTAFTVSSSK
jgi:lipopolysaccharide export system permease protein